MDNLDIKLTALQFELQDMVREDFAVLRGADSLCIRDEDLGPVAYLTLGQDEDNEDCVDIVFAQVAPPHIAAALAVMIDSVLPVFVDCETLFTATKVERDSI